MSQYLNQCWYWVPFYQQWVKDARYNETRRSALRYLTQSVVRFDRAERAQ